ncbi:rhodanese-like domain-containing protein [Thermoactinomyces sp. DSM 45892]|uniref:rhodanese-like domain-containing protein n=1 Tax=Thermoactinomyces sp. DSM 45892 TaxID=1882753 RepID=UPI000894C0AE|nr:rhodanese-like domain-containing protein [Thermoactinomyces sp. DSM 45892]SDY61570.1 Rhodanese-related sulfurtransferase [Thermoactinomyces sp. DSM 45892]
MGYQHIEASEVSNRYQEEKDHYVWVDVRTIEEYEEGHIPDSLHIPLDELEQRQAELADFKGRNILLICRSGVRSVYAAEVLADHGYTHLYNLKGGMLEWMGPVE